MKIWVNRHGQPCEERPYGERQIEVQPAEMAERLAIALEFYGDEGAHTEDGVHVGYTAVKADRGKRARDALKIYHAAR